MRRAVLYMLICEVGLLLNIAAAAAEKAYLTDVIRFSVRSGPANDQNSLGLVESGQMVDIVKPGGEWTLIRTTSGIEGYVLSRFLTSDQPAKFRIDQLQEKNKTLTAQAAGLVEENNRLKGYNQKLTETASAGQGELAALRNEFEAFKKDAAGVSELKARYTQLEAELAQKQEKITQLENQADDILNPVNLYWFLAGAGVLLVGFLTGFSVKRQRRWSSLG
jgi:SH3 domain protein